MFCEVIFENGTMSVMEVADKDEAMSFAAEHTRRAKAGEKSMLNEPSSPPAVRVVKLLFYDEHPNDYNLADSLTVDELKVALPDLVDSLSDKNGVVPVGVLASEVRGLSHPMIRGVGAHESKFLMAENEDMTIEAEEIDKAAGEL